ncbi:VRR-NUC domain-containing protein [Pseudomonas sp.]|uniref:VRR-NUC domain-containing protein n=1 Tax=Pseudomonas sp. TaxID=306 RepID=UPI003FD74612
MASESNVQRAVWLAMGRVSRLFRLNTGRGYVSQLGPKGVHRLKDGSIHIEAPRPIALGFGLMSGEPVKGACDLPGWTEIVITPEMVGRTMPVFTSIEAKATEGGRVSPDQKNWMAQVQGAGGIAGVARSPEEALQIVADWKAARPLNLG